MTKKIFPLWIEDSKINDIKQKAKKNNVSTSRYILTKIEEAPNLVLGDWWDNPDAIKKIARELKKNLK